MLKYNRYLYKSLFSKRLLFLITVENIEWSGLGRKVLDSCGIQRKASACSEKERSIANKQQTLRKQPYKKGCDTVKLFKIVIPTMIIVAILASWILAKDHSDLSLQVRIMITAGGALLSGILSYFLSKGDVESDN
jgi:hypothetical protein